MNDPKITNIYMTNPEKANRLSKEIICLLKDEHISLSEARGLFCSIIEKIEDTPMQLFYYICII